MTCFLTFIIVLDHANFLEFLVLYEMWTLKVAETSNYRRNFKVLASFLFEKQSFAVVNLYLYVHPAKKKLPV